MRSKTNSNRIKAELVMTDKEPTHTVADIPDEELLRRAVRNAKPATNLPKWSAVSERFALGSTYAIELCLRFDVDPHAIKVRRRR